jgi:hypothetical protein
MPSLQASHRSAEVPFPSGQKRTRPHRATAQITTPAARTTSNEPLEEHSDDERISAHADRVVRLSPDHARLALQSFPRSEKA